MGERGLTAERFRTPDSLEEHTRWKAGDFWGRTSSEDYVDLDPSEEPVPDEEGWPCCPKCGERLSFSGRCYGCDWRARE